jgi:hypothetical protein
MNSVAIARGGFQVSIYALVRAMGAASIAVASNACFTRKTNDDLFQIARDRPLEPDIVLNGVLVNMFE